jgi:hypothetical protein
MLRLRYGAALSIALALSWSFSLVAQSLPGARGIHPDSTFSWMVGGTVHAVERVGNTVFIGGRFRALAPRTNLTGGFAVLSAAHSRRAVLTPFVNGEVHAVVYDAPSASFFVAGAFERVGAADVSHIIRIHGNGQRDVAWSGRVAGRVAAMAIAAQPDGTRRLYVGGVFSHAGIGGTMLPLQNLAAFALAPSGPPTLVGGFAPNPDAPVAALAAVVDPVTPAVHLYVGGAFDSIGGQAIAHLARVHGGTGVADTWNPAADGDVLAMATAPGGTSLYVGGAFGSVGGSTRTGAAQVSTSDAQATAWNPSPDGVVHAMLLDGPRVYLGGAFARVDGAARQRLALVTAAEGAVVPTFDAPADDEVRALALGGPAGAPQLFVGGAFTNIGGRLRLHLAALNPATGQVTDWHPAFNDTVHAIATVHLPNRPGGPVTLVAVGGEFDAFGGVLRRNLAAINLESGELLPWRPAPDGVVRALHARAGMLYAGGDFTRIDQQPRERLAAFSLSARQLASWNPGADAPVFALASSVSSGGAVTVYAGGDFTTIGASPRERVAAIDAAGSATAWAPGADGRVLAILPTPSFVYLAGQFGSVGGLALPHLARADANAGAVDATWSPAPDAEVRALESDGASLFAGGVFATLGGATRRNIGAVNLTSGAATEWQPATDGAVNAVDLEGTTLYAGGTFSNVGVRRRSRLVGLDTTLAGPAADYVTAFAPRWIGRILDLDARGDGIVAAGDPHGAGDEDEPVSRVAFFPRLLLAPPAKPAGLGVAVDGATVTLRWTPPTLGARPDRYLLDAGVSPGGTEIGAGIPVAGLFQAFDHVPPGTYYLRVRAANARGTSPATEDVVVTVGTPACGAPLEAPSDLVATVTGSQVSLGWTPPSGGTVSGYRVEAGSSPGATSVQFGVAASDTTVSTSAPDGRYYVRVRALGPCGQSGASYEVPVLVGRAPTAEAPAHVIASVTGNAVALVWDAVPGAAGYRLEVGSAPGETNLVSVGVAASRFETTGVPPGTYFVRVRSLSAAGASPPSHEAIVVVP